MSDEVTRGEAVTVALDHATPSEIAREVLRDDAAEWPKPVLETARIGVDVLDVEPVDDALSGLRDHGDMVDAARPGEADVGLAAVGDEYCIALDQWRQCGVERAALEVVEDVIAGGLATVARNQHYVVVVERCAGLFRLAATLSRGSCDQLARALRRVEDQRLVGLDDA